MYLHVRGNVVCQNRRWFWKEIAKWTQLGKAKPPHFAGLPSQFAVVRNATARPQPCERAAGTMALTSAMPAGTKVNVLHTYSTVETYSDVGTNVSQGLMGELWLDPLHAQVVIQKLSHVGTHRNPLILGGADSAVAGVGKADQQNRVLRGICRL